MTVTVAHPALAGQLATAHRYWLYADDEQERHWKLAATIGDHAMLLVPARTFQSQIAAARAGFVAWTERCLNGLSAEAWLTTPFYKNPHDNPLFLHFCWLLEIDRHLAKGAGDLLVLTGSSGLAATVDALCRSHGVACRTAGFLRLRFERGVRIARSGAALLSHVFELLCRTFLARCVFGTAHRDKLRGLDVIVDTYLMERDLAADGCFTDRYLPGLVEYYARNGVKAASYPLLYGIPLARVARIFQRMKTNATLFLPFELYATWGDIAGALRRSLKAAVTRVPVAAADELPVDLRPVVEWHQPVTAARAFVALVLARVPARLADGGILPRRVIEWYENQPVDKASHIGFSGLTTSVQVVALRHYPPSPNWLSLYTTSAEVKAGASPMENWVCGSSAVSAMAVYDSVGSYRVAPSLRYAHLHSSPAAAAPGSRLLLLLPYSRADARAILRYAIPWLATLAASFGRVVVKPHYTVSSAAWRSAAAREWPDLDHTLLEWSEAPVGELLAVARLVVTGHSSAALEAVCSGKPVLVVGPAAGLAINVLEGVDGRLWRMVYDARELRDGVMEWSPEHPVPFEERIALGKAIRDRFFEYADETTMRMYLPR